MAYTPLGAQPGTAGNDSRHQLVGVQAAFHQCLDFAAGGESGTTLGCCMTVRHVLDAQALQLEPLRKSNRLQPGARSDQDRLDQPQPMRIKRGGQAGGIAGMNDPHANRRQFLDSRQQPGQAVM